MGCGSSKEVTPLPPQPRFSQVPGPPRPPAQPQHQNQIAANVPPATQNQAPASAVNHRGVHQPPAQVPAQGRSAADLSQQPRGWPKIVQLEGLPLTMYILSHTRWSPSTGTCPCWTYISSGLQAVNQPEIVLTIRQLSSEDLEDWPTVPVEWTRILYLVAKDDGLHIQTGQMCELFFQDPLKIVFGETSTIYQASLELWSKFQNIGMLIHFEPYGNISDLPPLPYPHHHVIALTHREAALAKEFGCHRVISRFCISTSWFPIPPWIDRDRKDVMHISDNAYSIHTTAPVKRARIHGLSVILVNDSDLIIRVPDDPVKRRAFQDHVASTPPSDGWACESFVPGDTDSMLSWTTENTAPQFVAKLLKPTCTSVAFVMVGLQDGKDSCTMIEDGYALILMQGTWNRLRAAMIAGRDFDMRMYDQTAVETINVRLRWRREGQEPQRLAWENHVGRS